MTERKPISKVAMRPCLNRCRSNRAEFSSTELNEGSFRVAFHLMRCLRHDVDDSVVGIEPINGCGGSFHDLDFLDFWKRDRQERPEGTAKGIFIDWPTIDQYKQMIGSGLVVSSNTDVEIRASHLHDFHAWDAPEEGWNIGGAGMANILIGNDVHIRGRL